MKKAGSYKNGLSLLKSSKKSKEKAMRATLLGMIVMKVHVMKK